MSRLVLPLPAGAMFCAIFLSLTPLPAVAHVVPTDVQQAVLAGDWNQVWTILGAEKTNPEPVELRLIKGHACLALNHNNQSLELFASALNDVDRTAWQQWADAFAEEHPASAIAWYFRGDALARQKQWVSPEKDPEEAKQSLGAAECFDEAIRLDPNCYLALNARGVVAHAVGNTLAARVYFLKATKAKEDFADGYASRGTLNIHLNSVKARDDYAKAKSHSTDEKPLLALIGLGCALVGQKQYGEALGFFEDAAHHPVVELLVEHNSAAAEFAQLDQQISDAAEVGMSVKVVRTEFDALESALRQNAHFARPGSGGGRLPSPRPPDREPKPGPNGGPQPKPGPRTPDHPGPVKPRPPIWQPIPPFWPPDYDPPTMPIPDLRIELRRLTALVNPGRSNARGPLPVTHVPGGVDTKGITKSRTNTGDWLVTNDYGLAYDVPMNKGKERSGTVSAPLPTGPRSNDDGTF
ncbi:MAG: tetratricopeptide repeat protein [Planctomycetes bacterium]|nr:tetratricopeptide repeat protein [Planctomycetota bacterium]